MTKEEIELIADAVALKMHSQCSLGLTAEDIQGFKELAQILKNWRTAKWKAFSAIVTVICIGTAGLLIKGIVSALTGKTSP